MPVHWFGDLAVSLEPVGEADTFDVEVKDPAGRVRLKMPAWKSLFKDRDTRMIAVNLVGHLHGAWADPDGWWDWMSEQIRDGSHPAAMKRFRRMVAAAAPKLGPVLEPAARSAERFAGVFGPKDWAPR